MQTTPGASAPGEYPSEHETRRRNGQGLWVAFALDGAGGARQLDWDTLNDGQLTRGPLWIHLDPRAPEALAWLRHESGLSEAEVAELLRDELRPRLELAGKDSVVVSLRGLAPELERHTRDLTRLCLRADPQRMISLCDRPLPGVEHARERFASNRGARDIAGLLVSMASWLGSSLQHSALTLEEPLLDLEDEAEHGQTDTSDRVHELQGRVTRLRRHLAPFKVVVRRALELEDCWFNRGHLAEWRSLADQAQDTAVLLQSLHERLTSVHDYVGERIARSMNYVLYVLTIFSTILLPLTFVTGLFGMNIGVRGGSYRFMESTTAFILVTLGLGVLGWLAYRLFKTRHLLPARPKRLTSFRP